MHRPTLTTDPWPHANTAEAERDGVALSQIGGILRRSWAWIAVPTLVAVIGAVAFVQMATPRYTGEAKVLLESRDPSFAKTASERSEQAQPIDEQAVASQVQVAMSRDIAREAIRRLKLVGNEEFDPTGGEIGPVKRVLMLLGLVKNPLAGAPEDRVLDAYFDKLLVYPVGKSRILSVEFRSKDAALAAQGANTIAELYIGSLADAQVDTARYASTWLGSNIDTLRARVAEAEAKVEAFRAKNGLIGSGGTANQPLSNQQLTELSSQLSQARTIKADLTARVKMLKEMIKDGRAFEIPDVANNELFRRTIESRMSLRAQLALESRTLLPAHPRIKELTAQVTDLETQIKATAERIVRTLDNDAKIAGARVESLQSAVDGQSDVVAKGNGSEVQLRALEREAKAQREQLESYLSRYREAAARDAGSAAPADARIVSRAVTPEMPSFPKKLPIVGVAAALAFLLSAGAVVGRHLLKNPPEPARRQAEARTEPAFNDADADAARDGATDADMERFSADPERLSYPEPAPPEPRHFAPALGAFENTLTAQAELRPSLPAEPVEETAMEVEGEDDVWLAAASECAEADTWAVPAAPMPEAEPYELDALVERLAADSVSEGRCVLVVETTPARADRGLARSLAEHLAPRARTVSIDVNGRTVARAEPGLSDLVAGEASFPDVIQAVRGSRLHTVGRGFVETGVLIEEAQGLAIGLNAMTQAYDWVVCRLDASGGKSAKALLSVVAANAASVVIASEAEADDSDLVTLYELAVESGAGQVLVARVRDAAWGAGAQEPETALRLRAA